MNLTTCMRRLAAAATAAVALATSPACGAAAAPAPTPRDNALQIADSSATAIGVARRSDRFYQVAGAGSVAPQSADASIVWGGLRFGMSVADVQRAFPSARVQTDPQPLLNDWAVVDRLYLENHPVLGMRATVKFFFKHGELSDIQMHPVPKSPERTASARVVQQLTADYGTPIKVETKEFGGDLGSVLTEWRAANARIGVFGTWGLPSSSYFIYFSSRNR